ncbi:MAG: PSD1 and planctomycete cytochrome C domain-containing protein [Acidobacteriota bacterium]
MIRRAFSALSIAFIAATAQTADSVRFNRDIRPIMSDTCFRCHGPDKSSRMADLRLDLRDEALKKTESGIIPIVPGKPDESEIVRRVLSDNAVVRMPPDWSHKVLTEKQKETVRQWVAEGAKYEGHWSFQPVRRPEVPEVKDSGAPIRNPIDNFIQARLIKEGLEPSHEADRHILIRRVTLDLTGLPPTPAEIEAFINDNSRDAYEKVVDRLLTTPAYAEKQALYWLDAVRFADTRGFHNDVEQPAWPFRDYVLKAFRDNVPFDQFTREQLAGDLLPNPNNDQLVATAFNRVLRTSEEGGIQDKEYLAKYGADRVRTIASAWLGLTMGCAECHDHKFDPVKTRDFYSMKAFFADIKETGILPASGPDAYAITLRIPSEEQSRRAEQLKTEIQAAQKILEEKTDSLIDSAWERRILDDQRAGRLKWHYQRPVSAHSKNGTTLTIFNDELLVRNVMIKPDNSAGSLQEISKPGNGIVVANGPNPDNETYTITLKPGAGTWTALAVQTMQDESLPAARQGRGADRFVLTEVSAELSQGRKSPARKLDFSLATYLGTPYFPENPPGAAIDGNPSTGWAGTAREGTDPFLALRFSQPVTTDSDTSLIIRLHFDSLLRRAAIGQVRLALSTGEYAFPETGDSALEAGLQSKGRLPRGGTIGGVPKDVMDALKVPREQRNAEQAKLVRAHFQWSEPRLLPELSKLEQLKTAQEILNQEIPRVMVTRADEPKVTRILARGNWMDDSGEIVQPAVPEFLGHVEAGGRRATRLDLANWLISRENPMTARAFANRQWRMLFGTGLSKVLDDLGSQGEWPTHPELLDWLAAEFMEPTWQAGGTQPWDIKHLLRTIVLSHTYRQSSLSTPELDEHDLANRLLARQSRIRVEAETVRDIALEVSGLLSRKFGGPSVNPSQPEGYLTALNFPKRGYSRSHGEDLYRRGLYTYWQRTFLLPSLLAFDASPREECTVNRSYSNTPLQALVLLNDPVFVEAARTLAENMIQKGGPSLSGRIEWAYLRALGRKPTASELKILSDLHRKTLADFSKTPSKARELSHVGDTQPSKAVNPVRLAAMTTVARAILNLHETITRN